MVCQAGVHPRFSAFRRVDGLQATGGGAFKYADEFRTHLGVTLDKEDEMKTLVAGLNFLLRVSCVQHS